MAEDVEKKVDNEWKSKVSKEKTTAKDEASSDIIDSPQAGFMIHVSQLAMQAMVFLGLMPHPVDQTTKVDLVQSKYLIDTIEVLQLKSKGNLSKEEEDGVATLLYDLRLKYLDAQKNVAS